MLRLFIGPSLVTVVALAAVFLWGGAHALVLALILSVLEVTLSFDNAVVNAKVLRRMDQKWQRRFLTWGILIAVVGTRLVLPILIVAASVWASPWAIATLAATDPEGYGRLLEGAHYAIAAFGGAFLMMVSLKYFFDAGKDVHWIHVLERYLARWGHIEAVEIAVALTALLVIGALVPAHLGEVLTAGLIGIILFIAMEGITSSMSMRGTAVLASGLTLFLYLNVLDSAFSLDGVVGAFALTTQLPVIIAGLGIGAYFVRTLTLYLVRAKALENLKYLEHGAHWAILGLALCMLLSLIVDVPELVVGGIGLFFILFSYISSRREAAAAR